MSERKHQNGTLHRIGSFHCRHELLCCLHGSRYSADWLLIDLPRFHGYRGKSPSPSPRIQRGSDSQVSIAEGLGIEYFDRFENVLPGFIACPTALMMHVFRFKRMQEAFNHGRV
jgi:hypothetical protein